MIVFYMMLKICICLYNVSLNDEELIFKSMDILKWYKLYKITKEKGRTKQIEQDTTW